MRRLDFLVLITLCLCAPCWAQESTKDDLNVALMRSTFRLEGTGQNGQKVLGTGFVLVRRISSQAPNTNPVTGKMVLITAAHVFHDMVGDEAVIYARARESSGQGWPVVPLRLQIRTNGRANWVEHPSADVAVMYVGLQAPYSLIYPPVIPDEALVTDEQLQKYEVVPGVQLSILGYPLGIATSGAFPILRTGVIASYPLTPTAQTKTFLVDFRVFKGNSGGPVYYAETAPKGGAILCCNPSFIMGLVSSESLATVTVDEIYETATKNIQLSLAQVVHASVIRQTVEMLPAPDSSASQARMVMLVPLTPASH